MRDCPVGVQTGCLLVDWPGMRTNAQHGWAGEQPEIDVWYGGLVDGMRDASGQMYMRNRYYDPATGQFTQTDPIGIAGGLNVYGFAAGDPVSYSDPYGLKAGGSCDPPRSDCPKERPTFLAGATAVALAEPTVAGEVALGVVLAVGSVAVATKTWHDRVWVTYTLTNPATGRVYAGRTSGWGDPQTIVDNRFRRHHMRGRGFGSPTVDAAASGFGAEDAIRGREQQLIDHHGGLASDGGTAGNAFRGVNKWNPFGRIYHGACLPLETFNSTARLIAHELGHAYDADRPFGRFRLRLEGRRKAEYSAIRRENQWARRNGQPERCRYGSDF